MDESNQRSNRNTGSIEGYSHERESQTPVALSRRNFLRSSAIAGAGALALGGSASVAARSVVDEDCEGDFGTVSAGDGDFEVINNDWGAATADYDDVEQCVFVNDDGSYGWEWERGPSGEINYPQLLLGTKPWAGDDTGVDSFPVQRGDVDDLTVDIDVDTTAGGGEWNFALEWWLTEDEGPGVEETITHEMMLVLEWGDQHDYWRDHADGGMVEEGAFEDDFGNVIDYWQYNPNWGDESWSFHIFGTADNEVPEQLDLRSMMDYIDTVDDPNSPISDDLWFTGVELGNENWVNSYGETTFTQFDVTINGETYASGSGESDSDPDPDPEPEEVDVNGDGNPAQDLSGDGLYEDVTGDDRVSFDDVVTFFDEHESPAVQDNVELFDFSGNGRVSFDDVVALFESL